MNEVIAKSYLWAKKIILSFIRSGVLMSGLLSLIILSWSHNMGWIPLDDSIFAYTAEQINNGAIYGVTVIDQHGGYQHFLNAWLFRVFGSDMVVLHYPLVLMGVIQAMIAAHLCRYKGFGPAMLAGFGVTIFAYLTFQSAAPNWYALFIAMVVIWFLDSFKSTFLRNSVVGLLIGICFMIRHPSAIFIGLGVLAYYIYESGLYKEGSRLVSKSAIVVLFTSLLVYLLMAFNFTGFALFGIWAFMILTYLWYENYGNDVEFIKKMLGCVLGFSISLIPILWYQLQFGNMQEWFVNSFARGPGIFSTDGYRETRYWDTALEMVFNGSNVIADPFNLLFATQDFLLAAIVFAAGIFLMLQIQKRKKVTPLLFVAFFYSYVSFYLQLEMYFFFTFPLFFIIFIQSIDWNISHKRVILLIMFLLVSCVYLFSASFSLMHKANGQLVKSDIPKLSLYLYDHQYFTLKRLLTTIDRYVDESDTIFAYPDSPEVYYLSERKNIFPFSVDMFYVNTENEHQEVRSKISSNYPNLVVWRGNTIEGTMPHALRTSIINDGGYVFVESVYIYTVYVRKGLFEADRVTTCIGFVENQ